MFSYTLILSIQIKKKRPYYLDEKVILVSNRENLIEWRIFISMIFKILFSEIRIQKVNININKIVNHINYLLKFLLYY